LTERVKPEKGKIVETGQQWFARIGYQYWFDSISRWACEREMTECCYSLLNLQFSSFPITDLGSNSFPQRFRKTLSFSHRSSKLLLSAISRTMEAVEGSEGSRGSSSPMKLLFVEMGVGYDQHGCCILFLFFFVFLVFFSFVFADMAMNPTDRT